MRRRKRPDWRKRGKRKRLRSNSERLRKLQPTITKDPCRQPRGVSAKLSLRRSRESSRGKNSSGRNRRRKRPRDFLRKKKIPFNSKCKNSRQKFYL